MNLIISTINSNLSNYPFSKATFLLTCPNGNLMIQETIKHIDLKNIDSIYIIILKKDIDNFINIKDLNSLFTFTKKKVFINLIENKTKNQPETIYNCIKKYNINGPIIIKDYKSFINFCPTIGNYIYYVNLKEDNNEYISHLYKKSYIEFNNLNHIINISEKQIISNYICIGAYSFKNVEVFLKCYEDIIKINDITTLNISHLVYKCILDNIIFYSSKINNFQDLSFYENWCKYCNKFKTLFVDIDGTLVLNSGEFSKNKWGETGQIKENVDYIKKLYATGNVKIILTTSRKKNFKNKTIQQLNKFEIPYDDIIFGLFHSKRFLINDYSNTNPYPSAIAINLKRDSNNLKDFFID